MYIYIYIYTLYIRAEDINELVVDQTSMCMFGMFLF